MHTTRPLKSASWTSRCSVVRSCSRIERSMLASGSPAKTRALESRSRALDRSRLRMYTRSRHARYHDGAPVGVAAARASTVAISRWRVSCLSVNPSLPQLNETTRCLRSSAARRATSRSTELRPERCSPRTAAWLEEPPGIGATASNAREISVRRFWSSRGSLTGVPSGYGLPAGSTRNGRSPLYRLDQRHELECDPKRTSERL